MICDSTAMAQHSTPHHDPDGVVLINQRDALEGYITSRDAPGFPVTISDPGSYRLTSNLYPQREHGAIEIAADDVTIDLNGFTITTDHADGINGVSGRSNIVIRNGTIRNGSTPVNLQFSSFVHLMQIQVYEATFAGVVLGDHASITDSSIHYNRTEGLRVGAYALIARNVVSDNTSDGINAGNGSIIEGNIVAHNQQGIVCNFCTITGNSVYSNDQAGIHVTNALINNNTAFQNRGEAIWCNDASHAAGANCLIINNTVTQNNVGLLVDCPSLIRENFAYTNANNADIAIGTETGGPCTKSGNAPPP